MSSSYGEVEARLGHLSSFYEETKASLDRLSSSYDEVRASLQRLSTFYSLPSLAVFACAVGFAAALFVRWLR
jgi:hypothetical protein